MLNWPAGSGAEELYICSYTSLERNVDQTSFPSSKKVFLFQIW
jgi:hypothetical protein